jgi:hypothetical protein
MAEVGSYCIHCGAKIEPNSKFCASCGRATPLAAAQETTAGAEAGRGVRIVKDVGGGRVTGTEEKRASAAWHLLPIFLGFIGGAYHVLRAQRRRQRKSKGWS